MKINLRFNEQNQEHSRITIFINGKNTGNLCLSPTDAIWFHHILYAGCDALSPTGSPEIEFTSSGKGPNPTADDIDKAVQNGKLRNIGYRPIITREQLTNCFKPINT